MSKNQIGLNIFSILLDKITKFYIEYAIIVEEISSNQETEDYNFDFN
ncbi:hypothetical protein DSAG12_00643 [Promethearchaeum syntrophicum]|uniref:Uncharacterized protein n=1 Tax=Promethearchaeum syntrophicum TaxID=2594042 RepID=A0A5B9D898_9ARCH|nr:hypothetical protein [Candidatus Prometheoarchaeum syntrophicum]QEE14826.1 hypothetical protein DSAG12_00643 [Candidatus Prometheoarchaeum syntrophicum]